VEELELGDLKMPTEVMMTDEFEDWYKSLSEAEQDKVATSVKQLEERGVTLGHPATSAINGASFAMRELRTQVKGDPLRTFYAFDPSRQAVLLIGGDKTGDDRFYERMVPTAEKLWNAYLEETGQNKPKK
jgi:hypothetical protein